MAKYILYLIFVLMIFSCNDTKNITNDSYKDIFCKYHPDSNEKNSLEFLKCKEREADLHTQTGWEEYNNVFHFERSIQIYNSILKSLETIQVSPSVLDFKKRIEEKKDFSKARIEAFRHYKRNHFPMAFFKSKELTFQGKYKKQDYFAIDGIIEELHENIIKLSQGKGQIPIYIINKDGKVQNDVIEYTFGRLTNIPPQFTPTSEDIIKIFPELEKGEIANHIKENKIDKLEIFFQNNLYDTVSFLIIENCGIIDKYTSFYIGELYLLKKENNKLSLHAVSIVDSPGRNLQEPFKESILSMKTYLFLVVLLFVIWFIWNEFNSNLEQSGKQKFKTFCIYLFSFSIFGIGMGHGIIYISEFLIPPWNSPGKEDSISFFILLIAFLFILLTFISFLLSKLEDSALFTRNRYYLSFYFAIVFMGLAGYLEFNLHYYYRIYPIDGSYEYESLIYMIRFFSPILGFAFGSAERDLLFHKSISELYNSHPENRIKSIFVYIFFTVFLIVSPIVEVIFIRSFLIVSNIQNYLFIIIPYFIFFVVQIIYSKKYNREVLNLKRNKEGKSFENPKKLIDLEGYLKNPEYIKYSSIFPKYREEEKSDSDSKIIEDVLHQSIYHEGDNIYTILQDKIIDALQKEGGVVIIQGKEGSGKTKFASDLTENGKLSNCITYHVKFSDASSSLDNDPFLPFLQSMKGIPEIRSIHEMIRLGKNANLVGGKLSGLVEHIPFVGGLLKFIFQSDTKLNLNSEENIIKMIANYILQHSREELIKIGEYSPNKTGVFKNFIKNIINIITNKKVKSNESEEQALPPTPDGGIIFILDDYQKINRECYQLILKIIEILQDKENSPETNKLCFLLVLDSDESFLYEKGVKLLRLSEYNFIHRGITISQLEDVFYDKLNFSYSTESFFYEVLSISGTIFNGENTDSEKFINPYLFFINLKEQLENIEYKDPFFVIKQNSNRKISFSKEILQFYKQNKKLSKLNSLQEEILQKGSLIGEKFSIKELSCLYEVSFHDIIVYELDKLSNTENSIIIEYEEGVYKFREELTRRILFESFSYNESSTKEHREDYNLKYILSLNYNKLLRLYQTESLNTIPDLEKKYAKIYMYFYKKNLNKAFEYNLKLLEKLYIKISENVVHSDKRILEKEILDILRDITLLFSAGLDRKELENSIILSVLSYMETEKQELIFEVIQDIDKLYSYILMNKEIFLKVNFISYIEIFYNSIRIEKIKNIGIPSMEEIFSILNEYLKNQKSNSLNKIIANFWIGNFYKSKKEFESAIKCFENNDFSIISKNYQEKFLYSKIINSKFECIINIYMKEENLEEIGEKYLPELDIELQKCLKANETIGNDHGDIKVLSQYLKYLDRYNLKSNEKYSNLFKQKNELLRTKSLKIKSAKGYEDYNKYKKAVE